MLCGETYCNRLWCVWELYVIFAFAPKEQAAARVELHALEGKAVVDVSQRLSEFKLLTAHCYDPNEEHKICGIVQECGQESFESHIRELGQELTRAQVDS